MSLQQFNAISQAKLIEAARLIREGAVEFLAAKYNRTEADIMLALQEPKAYPNLAEQFNKLVRAGIAEAMKLHDEGKIALVVK